MSEPERAAPVAWRPEMGWWFIGLYYGLSAALLLVAALFWSWVGWVAVAWFLLIGPVVGIWLSRQGESNV